MPKKAVIVLALAAVAIAGTVAYRRYNATPDNIIRISGNIELTQVDIAFKTSGRLAELAVAEGDAVKKGAILARLDRDQLLRQREQAEAALAAAQAALAQAGTSVEWSRETNASDIAQRRADLSQAHAHLRELEAGSRPQEVAEARSAVAAARSEFERAQADWQRAQQLFKDDDISRAQYDQFRSRAEATEAALRQTEQRLALVTEGPRRETIDGARAQVNRAAAAVQGAQAQTIDVKRRQQEVAARQAEVERARAQIAVIDAQLADTVAAAPIDGVTLVKSANQGEILAAGTAIVTLGDIEHPWLRGYINEADLGRVKLGTKAKITTDSYPGKEYWGRVSFVASEAEFTPKQIQTSEERLKLVYRIKIDVENQHRELKSNMPADAELVLE